MHKDDAAQIENTLAAAGFTYRPADSPEKQAHLKTLTQHKLVPHEDNGSVRYIYADAKFCRCLYAGDESAYERYRKLAAKERIAEERQVAESMNDSAPMDWGMWRPGYTW